MDTANEQPVNTVEADLRAAFEEIESGESVEAEAAAPEEQDTTIEETAEVEEAVEPEEVEEQEEPEEEVEEPESEESEEPDESQGIEPPAHWAQADKDIFSKQTPEAQAFLLERHKAMEADYTRKTQEIAALKTDMGGFYEKFSPYKANLAAQGVTPEHYLTNLVNADMMLARNPLEGLRQVAKMYGVDLGNSFGLQEGEEQDPQYASLQSELAELRNQVQAKEQIEAQSRQNAIVSDIEAFAAEVDESGNPVHPYFEEVSEDMVLLAHAERAAGREPKLEDLYERAVYSNTSVREKVLASQRQAEAKKAKKEARAKAEKAKKATKSVKGTTTATPEREISLREQIAQGFK